MLTSTPRREPFHHQLGRAGLSGLYPPHVWLTLQQSLRQAMNELGVYHLEEVTVDGTRPVPGSVLQQLAVRTFERPCAQPAGSTTSEKRTQQCSITAVQLSADQIKQAFGSTSGQIQAGGVLDILSP